MKKWLVLILVFVAAAGTFVPCCAIDDCCGDQPATTTKHDQHKEEGSCSPFFTCATCPGSVVVTKAIQMEFPLVEKTIYHRAIISFNLTTYCSSFWQPPRSC